jgi:hypothetical protein
MAFPLHAKLSPEEERPHLRRFLFLLVALLLTLVLGPLVEPYPRMNIVLTVFWSIVLLSSVYAISRKRHVIIIACLLALPFFAEEWASLFVEPIPLFVVGKFFGAAFFAFVTYNILKFIYSQTEVKREMLLAAAVVYLLIAVMWAYAYGILEMIHPGSFNFPDSGSALAQNRFIYFSLVTITTLGYGDITPNTGFAASLCMVEAVVGQLYMTVQVAWLVGIHVASFYEKRRSRIKDE